MKSREIKWHWHRTWLY